jgi:hypothetical protein
MKNSVVQWLSSCCIFRNTGPEHLRLAAMKGVHGFFTFEVSNHLECGATPLGDWCLMFHDNILDSSSAHLTLGDVRNMLPSNVGNQSPSDVAPHCGQMETTSAPPQELNTIITFVRGILREEPTRRHKHIIQFNRKVI